METAWGCGGRRGYLDEVFSDAGFTRWTRLFFSVFGSPDQTYPMSSGFGYVIPSRAYDPNRLGTLEMLRHFQIPVR